MIGSGGASLRRKLREAGGKFPLSVAMNYVLQICEGIAEAHAHGIVHRDLKPSNLFITFAPDGTDLVKILDFGISKWSDAEVGELTKDGMVLGSPKYMAPEQVFGATTIDSRADVWSIGAIFYQMLAGRTPYREPTLARFCQEILSGPPPRLDALVDVPGPLADLIERCLAQKPADRVPSVAELAGGLVDSMEESGSSIRNRLTAIMTGASAPSALPSSRTLTSTASGITGSVARIPGATKLSEATPAPSRVSVASAAAAGSTITIAACAAAVAVAVAITVALLRSGASHPAATAPAGAVVPASNIPAGPTVAPTVAPLQTAPVTSAPPATDAPRPRVVYVPVAAKPVGTAAPVPATTTPPPKKNNDEIPTMR